MKYNTFILLCLLSFLICDDLGGVKIAINEKFIENTLRDFEPDIKKILEEIKIPDSGKLRGGIFGVPNFNMNMIKLEFLNNGLLHIKISDCTPYFKGSYHYKILWVFNSHNNFNADFKNFRLEAQLKIKSRALPDGGYTPDVEFISGPDINFKLDVSCDGFLHWLISWVINTCQGLVKPFILPKIKQKARDALSNILKNFKTKASLGNGLWLDFTLASQIKLQNKFIELNSYAFLFNQNYKETQNRNKYPLTSLPSINSLGKNLQFYASEYTINSALFTLLTSANRVIPFKISTKVLNNMLPGIVDKYGEKEATVTLNGSPESKIQITEQYMNVQVPGTFSVKVEGVGNEVFNCNLELNLKVNINIKEGPKISGSIKEISAKIKKVNLNSASNSVISVIENGFQFIQSTIIEVLNKFIENYIQLKFPTVMGISFTNVTLELKNKYFVINYDITRVQSPKGDPLNDYCNNLCRKKTATTLRMKCRKACKIENKDKF